MPFTLAHPAAVLPLRRTKLVFSALVVGSMTPDFPYFVTLADEIRWGHSWKGVFLFCLPAGLAVLWLFHAVVKRPLVSLAPEFVRKRVAEDDLAFRFGPLPRFALILGSLLLGTLTHILWDGFTHQQGLFVKHWPALSQKVMLHHLMPLWKALQVLCSMGGLALVAAITVWWWYQKPVAVEPVSSTIAPRARWLIIAIAGVLACGVGIVGGYPVVHTNWKVAIVHGLIYATAACFAEILIFSLAAHALGFLRRKEDALESGVPRPNVTVER